MKTHSLLAFAAAAALLSGCGLFRRDDDRVIIGSGHVSGSARAISGVTAIRLEGAGEVEVEQGATEALVVEAEDNILPLITSTVVDGTLTLGFNRTDWRDNVRPTQPIRYQITVRNVAALELAGSGNIHVPSLRAENLALLLSGQGAVGIEALEAVALTTRLDGEGDVTVAGHVQQQTLALTGIGDIWRGTWRASRPRLKSAAAATPRCGSTARWRSASPGPAA